MEDYIVRIQSIVEGKPAYFGTGIVVGSHEVLTARHVVSGESHVLLTEDRNSPIRSKRDGCRSAFVCGPTASFPERGDIFRS